MRVLYREDCWTTPTTVCVCVKLAGYIDVWLCTVTLIVTAKPIIKVVKIKIPTMLFYFSIIPKHNKFNLWMN